MGKEVVYCFNCGNRLLHGDFESSAAFRVAEEYTCASCLPLLLEKLPPAERAAFRKAAGLPPPADSAVLRVSTRRTQPVKTARRVAASPPPRRRRMILAGSAAGLLAVVAAAILLLGDGGKPPDEMEGPVVVPPETPAAKPAPPGGPGGGEEAVREEAPGPSAEMEALLAEIKGPLEGENFRVALEILGRARERRAASDWVLAVAGKIDEVDGEVRKRWEEVSAKAREARERGEASEVGALRERVARWGIGKYVEEFDRAFAMPAGTAAAPPAEPKPAERTEEGKGYLARWKEAMGAATRREYEAAVKSLEEAFGGLQEERTKQEAEEDLKDLKGVAALYEAAVRAVVKYGLGREVNWGLLEGGEVKGSIIGGDEEHLEIRAEGETEVRDVEPADLGVKALMEAARERDSGEGARAAVIWFLLEGEGEEAKKAGPVEIPEKYREYAEGAKEKLARRDSAEERKEREAKVLLWGARRAYPKMETLGEAVEKYRMLARDYVGASIVVRNIKEVTLRSAAGKDYFFLTGGIKGSGNVRLKAHPELERAWTCEADVVTATEGLRTYVEVEFYALPGTAYRCWVYAGACCLETFTVYVQATGMLGPNPQKRTEKIPYEPGGHVAAPLEPRVRSLRRRHSDHKGEKEPSKWEWVEVPLPEYGEGGLKKVRLLTEHKGFSVAMAVVSSVRKAPPEGDELNEERKRAAERESEEYREAPGLAGHWKLDEAGGEAQDSSGRGRHGRVSGNPRAAAGVVGGALELDGVGDFVDTGYAVDTPNWTVAIWVNGSAAPGGGAPNGPFHREKNFQINWDHGDATFRGAAALSVGKKWHAASFGPLRAGQWYHLAATYDGETLRAYKDGVLVTENGAPSGPPDAEPQTLKVGRHAQGNACFKGRVDDARLYDRALGAEEIEGLHRAGLAGAGR